MDPGVQEGTRSDPAPGIKIDIRQTADNPTQVPASANNTRSREKESSDSDWTDDDGDDELRRVAQTYMRNLILFGLFIVSLAIFVAWRIRASMPDLPRVVVSYEAVTQTVYIPTPTGLPELLATPNERVPTVLVDLNGCNVLYPCRKGADCDVLSGQVALTRLLTEADALSPLKLIIRRANERLLAYQGKYGPVVNATIAAGYVLVPFIVIGIPLRAAFLVFYYTHYVLSGFMKRWVQRMLKV